MNHVIPNPTQLASLAELYNLHFPDKNVSILTSGLVVHRRPKAGSKIIGQIIVIDGWLTCFVMNGTEHYVIWENLVEPAPSEMDLLKARVAELEKLVL